MLGFFDNITNVFTFIWELISNSIEIIIDAIGLGINMSHVAFGLVLFTPSIVGLSITLVMGVCVIRFLLMKQRWYNLLDIFTMFADMWYRFLNVLDSIILHIGGFTVTYLDVVVGFILLGLIITAFWRGVTR